MKRMLTLLITLFLIYFMFEFGYNYFSKGHDVSYEIASNEKNISVHEVLTVNNDEQNNYFIEVKYDNYAIPFKLFNDYGRKEKIIRNINIFESDTYICAKLEVEGDKYPNDIECLNKSENIVYLYSSIQGKDLELDKNIKDFGYIIGEYKSNEGNNFYKDNITIYPDNFDKKQNLVMDSYKGLYYLDNTIKTNINTIDLFNNDVYDRNLEIMVDKYYVIADYNSSHQFNKFNIINMKKGTKSEASSNLNISFNSFFQGVVGKKLYLIDKENKKQYEIDPSKKSVEVIGNQQIGCQVYENGEWVTKGIDEVVEQNVVFNSINGQSLNNDTYYKIDLIGNKTSGTYYAYKKNKDQYDVYAIYTYSNTKIYLFTTSDINRISYNKGTVYFVEDESLMSISGSKGLRKLLESKELKYNTHLNFAAY